MPNSTQIADQVRTDLRILGGIGPACRTSIRSPFRAVAEPRFGYGGLNSARGPGFANVDLSVYRQFELHDRWNLQVRLEAFNLTNTPHFDIPQAANRNVSNPQLNPDGSVRDLGGFSSITTTANSGRDGIDERVVRLGVRLGF